MKITIKCNIPDRWVNDFLSLLYTMQRCGRSGMSRMLGFYSDGDGDFRPKFKVETKDGPKDIDKLPDFIDKCKYTEEVSHFNFDAG